MKSDRRIIRHIYKCTNQREDHLKEREDLKFQIEAHARDGQVGLYWWQMDCDCASWDGVTILPAHPIYVEASIQDLYNNAEGPVRWHLTKPETIESTHRDHALEAFEEGHPHVVYY